MARCIFSAALIASVASVATAETYTGYGVLNAFESAISGSINSSAIGYVGATLDTTALTVTLNGRTSGITPTLAHIHGPAFPGQSAGVLVTLTASNIFGVYSVTSQQAAYMLAGKTYVNLHTTGELRVHPDDSLHCNDAPPHHHHTHTRAHTRPPSPAAQASSSRPSAASTTPRDAWPASHAYGGLRRARRCTSETAGRSASITRAGHCQTGLLSAWLRRGERTWVPPRPPLALKLASPRLRGAVLPQLRRRRFTELGSAWELPARPVGLGYSSQCLHRRQNLPTIGQLHFCQSFARTQWVHPFFISHDCTPQVRKGWAAYLAQRRNASRHAPHEPPSPTSYSLSSHPSCLRCHRVSCSNWRPLRLYDDCCTLLPWDQRLVFHTTAVRRSRSRCCSVPTPCARRSSRPSRPSRSVKRDRSLYVQGAGHP
jgi:hypothetical protein